MNAYVFTGPTLSPEDGREVLDAHFLPPAAQGDVYAVARQRPTAIGIIDGFFDHVPSVWHKEILWALSNGVHVFGASSMGALRAAELERFGMVGVGSVFADFAAGRLEDDDEVTIVHGPAESGFRPGSEAMVNVRATLDAALEAGIIGAQLRDRLVVRAKAWHYSARNWPRLLGESATGELEALKAWLPDGRVDRKREDALAMLRTMGELLESEPGPKQVSFSFHHTHLWNRLRFSVDEHATPSPNGSGGGGMDGLLEELQLQGRRYRLERESAMVRLLALEVAQGRGLDVDGATSRNEFERAEDGPAPDSRIAREESLVGRIRTISQLRLDPHFRDHLEVWGEAPRLRQRAEAKQAALTRAGLDNPSLADVDIDEQELWRWYFRVCLDREPAEDLEAWAESIDFKNVNGLRRAVLREYCYRRLGVDGEGGGQ